MEGIIIEFHTREKIGVHANDGTFSLLLIMRWVREGTPDVVRETPGPYFPVHSDGGDKKRVAVSNAEKKNFGNECSL